jgi:hypothetical protein
MYKVALLAAVMAVNHALGTKVMISSVLGKMYKVVVLFAPVPVGMTQFDCAVAWVWAYDKKHP